MVGGGRAENFSVKLHMLSQRGSTAPGFMALHLTAVVSMVVPIFVCVLYLYCV